MTTIARTLVFWTPRFFGVLFALFISMFALDVFGEGRGFWETTLALLMHLIPAFAVVAALVISWRREWLGGILFIGLGLLHLYSKWGKLDLGGYLIVDAPAFVLGILFLVNWRLRSELRRGPAV